MRNICRDKLSNSFYIIESLMIKVNPMSKPEVASKTPFQVEVEAGKDYWWCACGKSKKQPYCDGSHKGSEFAPVIYTATENTKVWFCGCKQTGNKPMCDGTHSKL